MVFKFAQPWWLIAGAILTIAFICIRYFWYKPTRYTYPLLHFVKKEKLQASAWWTRFFYWIHIFIFSVLVVLLGKPQFVDNKSKIHVEGIDIMLLLDMSGSMACVDDLRDIRTRLDVAKKEALTFIDQRTNDALGLVLFGRYALARCPLTLDKNILKKIIGELQLGQPSEDMQSATMLSQGMITALRRLQQSKAKSKVIILLTDGAPSQGDLDPKDAVQIAQDLNVKIYTIGIGGQEGGFINDTIFGWRQVLSPLNTNLLDYIARSTGGKFFLAEKPDELKKIYQIIDSLERQTYETELYEKYHDYFLPLVWIVIVLVLIHLFVATWICFIV